MNPLTVFIFNDLITLELQTVVIIFRFEVELLELQVQSPHRK